jgi:CRP/FNR family transcriptional regulator, anaerobic regulatory protein
MHNPLIAYFSSITPLSPEALQFFETHLIHRSLPAKEMMLQSGQTANHAFYIVKGLARAYYVKDGNEITTRFMDEKFIITSFISFYNRKPGQEYIETLEPIELIGMDYDNLQYAYDHFPEVNTIGRKLTERYFYLSELRVWMLRKLTAEERYQQFVEMHANLLQRVPLKYIATYLGMSVETLSRIRRQKR